METKFKSMPDLKDDTDIKIALKFRVKGVYKGQIIPGIIIGGKMFKKGLPNFSDQVDYYGLRNLNDGVKSGWFTITECTPENPFAIKPTSVTLNNTVLTLTEGDIANLTATIKPDDASQEVVWDSSDKKIAAVSKGKITAIKAGLCNISATTSNNITAKCAVNVSAPTPPSSKEEEVKEVKKAPKKRKKATVKVEE